MPDIILHHYPLSTYSEKVRLALGRKGIAYKEVITPVAMPKPDLLPLTGGYRRAPVMQIGADVYCDTQLILATLERLHPEPTLFPGGSEGEATAIAWWAEKYIFMLALGFIANVNDGLFQPDFVAERKDFGFIIGKEDVAPHYARYVQQLSSHLGWFAAMLRDGRPFMLGQDVSAADFAAYPALWFMRKYGGDDTLRLPHVRDLLDWVDRVAVVGHGSPSEISGTEALEIARAASPAPVELGGSDPSGLAAGTHVTVTPDDTGRDPVAGELVAASDQEVVILRRDERLGDIHVHFPRAGYDVVRR